MDGWITVVACMLGLCVINCHHYYRTFFNTRRVVIFLTNGKYSQHTAAGVSRSHVRRSNFTHELHFWSRVPFAMCSFCVWPQCHIRSFHVTGVLFCVNCAVLAVITVCSENEPCGVGTYLANEQKRENAARR